MPRRPPPTPLLLVHGPLPPRGQSKFTMPSVPRPIFHPPSVVARSPVPCERAQRIRRGTLYRSESQQESPSPLTSSSIGRTGTSRVGFEIEMVVAPPKAVVGLV
ncbi:hypothetical protein BGW80DRAFT_1270383 [Lactifluus volemus]|nr:hypothetical protein BGW80DRAFT_1270383 [Lactifluus volemus]